MDDNRFACAQPSRPARARGGVHSIAEVLRELLDVEQSPGCSAAVMFAPADGPLPLAEKLPLASQH